MTFEDGLDEISTLVDIKHMGDIHKVILALQNRYIEQRLRFFWRLPLIRGLTRNLVKLLFTQAKADFNIKEQTMTVTQKVMLASRYKYLASILLKVRK